MCNLSRSSGTETFFIATGLIMICVISARLNKYWIKIRRTLNLNENRTTKVLKLWFMKPKRKKICLRVAHVYQSEVRRLKTTEV